MPKIKRKWKNFINNFHDFWQNFWFQKGFEDNNDIERYQKFEN